MLAGHGDLVAVQHLEHGQRRARSERLAPRHQKAQGVGGRAIDVLLRGYLLHYLLRDPVRKGLLHDDPVHGRIQAQCPDRRRDNLRTVGRVQSDETCHDAQLRGGALDAGGVVYGCGVVPYQNDGQSRFERKGHGATRNVTPDPDRDRLAFEKDCVHRRPPPGRYRLRSRKAIRYSP
jgi:hypothetical protein